MTADEPRLDIDRLLTTLHRHQVDFILVGGVAAISHGAVRPTMVDEGVLDKGPGRGSGATVSLAAQRRLL